MSRFRILVWADLSVHVRCECVCWAGSVLGQEEEFGPRQKLEKEREKLGRVVRFQSGPKSDLYHDVYSINLALSCYVINVLY